MQGLKLSILMGKLKQSLPHSVSPVNDLFLAMFLIRLPPSSQDEVGSGDHMTAIVMVKAADTLWDARVGHDPMFVATTTHHSRGPGPAEGRGACSKIRPPSTQGFLQFSKPW